MTTFKNNIKKIPFAIVILLVTITGCGPRLGDNPLMGTITFEGKPVPGGAIQFVPDSSKGNSGTGASATIENGKYATSKKRGIFGGAYTVTVLGTDGTTPQDMDADTSLFDPYVMHVDLPAEGGAFDIDIPNKDGEFVKINRVGF